MSHAPSVASGVHPSPITSRRRHDGARARGGARSTARRRQLASSYVGSATTNRARLLDPSSGSRAHVSAMEAMATVIANEAASPGSRPEHRRASRRMSDVEALRRDIGVTVSAPHNSRPGDEFRQGVGHQLRVDLMSLGAVAKLKVRRKDKSAPAVHRRRAARSQQLKVMLLNVGTPSRQPPPQQQQLPGHSLGAHSGKGAAAGSSSPARRPSTAEFWRQEPSPEQRKQLMDAASIAMREARQRSVAEQESKLQLGDDPPPLDGWQGVRHPFPMPVVEGVPPGGRVPLGGVAAMKADAASAASGSPSTVCESPADLVSHVLAKARATGFSPASSVSSRGRQSPAPSALSPTRLVSAVDAAGDGGATVQPPPSTEVPEVTAPHASLGTVQAPPQSQQQSPPRKQRRRRGRRRRRRGRRKQARTGTRLLPKMDPSAGFLDDERLREIRRQRIVDPLLQQAMQVAVRTKNHDFARKAAAHLGAASSTSLPRPKGTTTRRREARRRRESPGRRQLVPDDLGEDASLFSPLRGGRVASLLREAATQGNEGGGRPDTTELPLRSGRSVGVGEWRAMLKVDANLWPGRESGGQPTQAGHQPAGKRPALPPLPPRPDTAAIASEIDQFVQGSRSMDVLQLAQAGAAVVVTPRGRRVPSPIAEAAPDTRSDGEGDQPPAHPQQQPQQAQQPVPVPTRKGTGSDATHTESHRPPRAKHLSRRSLGSMVQPKPSMRKQVRRKTTGNQPGEPSRKSGAALPPRRATKRTKSRRRNKRRGSKGKTGPPGDAGNVAAPEGSGDAPATDSGKRTNELASFSGDDLDERDTLLGTTLASVGTSISSGYHGENSSSDGEPSSQPPALQTGIARPGSGFLSLPSVDSELAAMSHRSTIAPLGRVDPPQVPPTSHSTRLARHRRDFFDKARRLVGCVRVCRRSRGTLRVVLISVCTTHVCAGLHKKPHLEAKLCVADSNLVSPRSPWDSTNRAALVAS